MSINEALQLVDEMKKRGVLEFKFEELQIKFDPVALHIEQDLLYTPPVPTPAQKAELERNPKLPANSADEDLYWSV